MNPNITVVNENLWTVNFSYVGMNFIRELTFDKTTALDFMTLTQDGKLVMNSADKAMMQYLPVMKVLMSFPDRLIGTDRGFCSYIKVFLPTLDKQPNDKLIELLKEQKLYDAHRQIFNAACRWEKTRRQLHRNFVRKHWFFIAINKLLKRKGG